MKYCGTCASCHTRLRWENTYKKYLEDYPSQDNEEFIGRQRKIDREHLKCLRNYPEEPCGKGTYINYFPEVRIWKGGEKH